MSESENHDLGSARALSSCELHHREVSTYDRWLWLFLFRVPISTLLGLVVPGTLEKL
jgi:hypothetical protein